MKYLFGKQFFIIGLALIGLVLLSNHLAESQLTFSTNWDGGKRSVENWEIPGYFNIFFDSNNALSRRCLNFKENKIRNKRRPGWGKRSLENLLSAQKNYRFYKYQPSQFEDYRSSSESYEQ